MHMDVPNRITVHASTGLLPVHTEYVFRGTGSGCGLESHKPETVTVQELAQGEVVSAVVAHLNDAADTSMHVRVWRKSSRNQPRTYTIFTHACEHECVQVTHMHSMCVYKHTRTHVQYAQGSCMSTHMYMYTHTHVHARMHTHVHTHARTHAHTYTHMHARTHTHTHAHMDKMDKLGSCRKRSRTPGKARSPGRHFRDYGPVQNKLLKPGQVLAGALTVHQC